MRAVARERFARRLLVGGERGELLVDVGELGLVRLLRPGGGDRLRLQLSKLGGERIGELGGFVLAVPGGVDRLLHGIEPGLRRRLARHRARQRDRQKQRDRQGRKAFRP